MNKYCITVEENTFFYIFWTNQNAKSINDLVYISTCRKEVFNTFDAAIEKINEIKEMVKLLRNEHVSNSLKKIADQLEIKELKC